MGTGYVRTDTANNIANGNVIDADDLDNEFNAVEAAFNVSTGHTHDGTAAEGAPIEVIGPAQDIVATTSTLRPKTTNTVDLGTTTIRYKDLYLEGNADIDGTVNVEGATTLQSTLDVTSNVTIGGNLTVTGDATISGNLTFGDAITDTITLTADVSSNILPSADDTYDLGATGSEWRDLYIDGTANIDTASIDTANIGTLAVSGNGTVTGDLTVSGTINATVTGTSSTADALTTARTISISGITSGSVNFDGSANVDIATTTLTLGGTAVTATGAEINILDGVTATTAEINTLAGITASTAELNKLDGVTATTAEINTLAGITSSTAELNTLDGILASTAELNTLDGITASTAELNTLDGITASTTELNKLDGVTATTAELNTLAGITASTTELNYMDGVTSNVQTQLDAKLSSVDLSSYTGDVDITGELVVDSYNETYAAITSSSGTATIDCEAGNVFALTLSENVTTFTWSNPPASGTAYGFSLKVIQGSSAYTITWPTSVDWPDATAPTLSTGSGAVDQFVFYTHDGGTTWYGFVSGQALG
jgi:cytoskeletal protein CcmA (bactofilin family)